MRPAASQTIRAGDLFHLRQVLETNRDRALRILLFTQCHAVAAVGGMNYINPVRTG